jgi:hypothetical protein
METLEQVNATRPLLIIGGNLALDFANTLDDPGGPRHFDHIGEMQRLLTWAQNRGLFTQPEHDELRASIHEHQSEAQRDLEHLLTGDRIDRIKHCASCPWLFLDQSKNGRRRWCSMDDCGTNAKIRGDVAQRAARRGATA